MQIELLEASKEIRRSTNCYNGRVLLDTLGGRFDTYASPEEALANKAFMLREIIDEGDSECDGSTCMRVSVVVDVFKRDNDEPRFSPCDENEVADAIEYYYKARKEAELQEANKEEANKEDDGYTRLEGLPFKIENIVFHDASKEKPKPNGLAVVLLSDGIWFIGRNDGYWKFVDGELLDTGIDESEVVAWFYIPTVKKL